MLQFSYDALPGRVVFGPGTARTALAAEADRLGGRRVLVVATTSEEPLARELTAPLGGRVVAVFTAVRPHVPIAVATAARALAADVRADLVLSIGGGSTTGTAKSVALTTGLPVLAVPTTYAGSEVTPVWGLTEPLGTTDPAGPADENGPTRKTTGTDPRVLPRTVVYDPELTLTLPAQLSGASALNAMAHCVEAFWAPHRNPVSSLAAAEGIRALAAGLPAVVTDPSSLPARSDLLYGCYLAGAAFAVAGSGLHHKICHVLGGAYDSPHAQTHAIVLPHVLAYNGSAAPDAVRRIGAALHEAGTVPAGSADAPATALQELGRRVGVPHGLADLGLSREQVVAAADLVLPAVPTDNPRPVSADDLRRLLLDAWSGTAISPPERREA